MAQKKILNDWSNVVSTGRNELVFEDKNKEYGAYQLRRNYNRVMTNALLVSSISLILLVSLPKIIELLGRTDEEVVVPVDISAMELDAPPPVDETEPPPPPPPPPPVMETIKFTPPVVVDEEVPDEDTPPPQEAITQQVATVTQEGSGDDIIIPTENTGSGVIEEKADEVFTIVEQMPSFPGGEAELSKYLSKNIRYPQMEKDAGISGTVYVSFVVNREGKIKDAKILRGVKGGPGMDKEALRVIESMPSWSVGKQNGRPVQVQFNLPIKFSLK